MYGKRTIQVTSLYRIMAIGYFAGMLLLVVLLVIPGRERCVPRSVCGKTTGGYFVPVSGRIAGHDRSVRESRVFAGNDECAGG